MSLAKLIDPSRIFAEPLGLTTTEHFGQILGVGNNFVSRQAEIFRHAKENSIELGTYIKQLTMSQKQFEEQRERLHQSTKNLILSHGTQSYIYWANLGCSFVLLPLLCVSVIINCCRVRHIQRRNSLEVRLWVLLRDQTLTHLSSDISLVPKYILNHNISLESRDPGLSIGSNCLILCLQI